GQPFEGDGGPGDVAGFGEGHLQPLADGAVGAAGAPRGHGGAVQRRVRGASGVAPRGDGKRAGLSGGGGDGGEPLVVGDRGVGLPGGVDDVGGGHVAVELLGGAEGGRGVAPHVGVDDLDAAHGVGGDGVGGGDPVGSRVVADDHRPVVGEQALFGQGQQRLGAAGHAQRAVGGDGGGQRRGAGDRVDVQGPVGLVVPAGGGQRVQAAHDGAEGAHAVDARRVGQRLVDAGGPASVVALALEVVADQQVAHAHAGQGVGQARRAESGGEPLVDGVGEAGHPRR